jgi:hypothetical protein
MKMISWSGDTSIAHFGEITLVARDQSLATKCFRDFSLLNFSALIFFDALVLQWSIIKFLHLYMSHEGCWGEILVSDTWLGSSVTFYVSEAVKSAAFSSSISSLYYWLAVGQYDYCM